MSSNDKQGFGTKAVHAGVAPDPTSGAIMTPIYQTSTYVQEAPGKHKGYEYARTQNPTRDALQASIAALENGKYGICFSSGLAAMDAVIKLFQTGDDILCGNDLYGGSYRLLTKVYGPMGIKSRYIDMTNLDLLRKSILPETKLIWLETPTNPTLQIFDIKAICMVAKEKNIPVAVDNTFASPYLQNPLALGATIVHHSITKYIAGHSDVIMGGLIVNDDALAERLKFLQNASGAVPGPQDCFLTLRGIKTLHIRMDRSCENAMRLAQYLQNHPRVGKVMYPGLKTHPQYTLAASQMKNFGAMISFDLKDDSMDAANKVLGGTKLFSLAESLGGVESLIGHPASMTHASIPREQRLASGLTDSLIRLSVGIESYEDLEKDIEQALK
ncbi:MAG: PLP-dependent transferase [Saprospiraceae bacterium]|uniref:PLP-dependent transferase n=1 Tax=Candidatus Opimibacter skivensis TaxID=2982028 RepID=A0A9D7SV39_9BACT|nr:PLP-dependent transferase [Candidatus Opimibacter skivensis]